MVPPDTGKTFLNFRLGITRDEEQSIVNFVFICRRVGTSALALVSRGEYPPLASMVIICFPSSVSVTLSVTLKAFGFVPAGLLKITTARIMVINARMPGIIIFFINEMSE